MKKNAKLPTILGIIILVIGLITGIYLINSKQIFKLSANIEAIPKDVRFSNITNNSLTVSWSTDIESQGFIKWGNSENSLNKVSLDENSNSGNSQKSYVHSANIIGTIENSNVFVKINSETKDYDNNGIPWQSKMIAKKISQKDSLIASGKVILNDGISPAKALVYLSINGVILSGITSDEGNFIIPISTYIENVSDSTAIDVTINAGVKRTSQAIIYSKAIRTIPTMVIGKTYDFRSLTQVDDSTAPKSSISIPTSIELSSRFEITKNENVVTTNSVTIDSINDNEIINTTNPEFFGKGPKNTDVQIEVQSELQQAAVTTDSKGVWNWSPPNNLEPGEHKVIIKWRDANGILRTITRNFIVQASEGPAFESTPSATPTNRATSTPISTSSATPKATKTPTTTAPPTPETGSLTPTIGLFIMGIGILLSSMFVYKKSYV
ncbi:MAG: hypothetical protein ACD_19C00016G0035 [uncultured bacterium]|nr:MAG: hypothetical protein ACD_19C00016G0035 [uncultured bacterium]